jgi:serine/threonine protein phosphatase 1
MIMASYLSLHVTGRTFVVGDLHGCLSPLLTILQQVNFSAEQGDVCILLGDLTDRGPDSLGCLSLLDKQGVYSVKGNHEQMCCAALRNESLGMYCWVKNGGNWFNELSTDDQQHIRKYWQSKLELLPLAIDVVTADQIHIGICHADPVFNSWPELISALDTYQYQKREALIEKVIWSRERIAVASKTNFVSGAYQIQGVDWCIMGHTPIRPTPFRKGNCIWIDSGAVFPDGYLSVLEVNHDMHCHQARL